MKQSYRSSVNVASWLRESMKDTTTALGNTCSGNFVRSIILIQKQDDYACWLDLNIESVDRPNNFTLQSSGSQCHLYQYMILYHLLGL